MRASESLLRNLFFVSYFHFGFANKFRFYSSVIAVEQKICEYVESQILYLSVEKPNWFIRLTLLFTVKYYFKKQNVKKANFVLYLIEIKSEMI